MLSPESEDEEFEFYLQIAKPLVLNLPNINDRIKAAAWVRYLKNDTTDPVLRGEYLKLLLFVLQRRTLFGPFASIPDESIPIQKFPDEINIQDVAKNFVDVDKQILKEALERDGREEWPEYSVACSSDLKEYVAKQDIPNFGVQAYFAISKDPLQLWDKCEKAIFPLGESIDDSNTENYILDTTSPDISCFVAPDQSKSTSDGPLGPTPRIAPKGQNDDKPTKELGDVAPIAKEDSCSAKDTDEFNMEARVPPTWGSNLMNVKESPSPTSRRSPAVSVKDLDIEISEQDLIDFFNEDIDLSNADIDELAHYMY